MQLNFAHAQSTDQILLHRHCILLINYQIHAPARFFFCGNIGIIRNSTGRLLFYGKCQTGTIFFIY